MIVEEKRRSQRRVKGDEPVASRAFLEKNPSYVRPTFDVLAFCENEQPFEAVTALLENTAYAKTFVARPDAFVALLRDHDLLAMTIYVDGVRYEGTLDELRDDKTVADDAVVTYGFAVTDEGRDVAHTLAPKGRLAALFEADEAENLVYQRILTLADQPEGIAKADIEKTLFAEGLIPVDERTGLPVIFPAYYIDNLERAGGLVWESSWKTTEEGRRLQAR